MPLPTRAAPAWRARLAVLPVRWLALALLVGLAALFYGPFLSHLPEGLHAWAQADRLALAINFYDFGFDFWHPRTSSYASIGGITGVEFPVQAYLAALGGLVFGRGAIGPLFRLLDVGVMVLGFWYLFRLVHERTGNFAAALVPAAFLLSSPTYAFYAGSFLPDPVSLSLTFVGYYYWLRFFREVRFRHLILALAVLTLAGLIKTTSALHLGAVVGITLVWAFLEPTLLAPRQRRWLLGLVVASFAAIGLMLKHNDTLNTTYQSQQFLSALQPIETAERYHEVWTGFYRNWLLEYATHLMYWTLLVALALVLAFGRRNLRRDQLPLTLLVLAAGVISQVFFKLMGAQFNVHDYYVICSFGPPTVLALALAMVNLGRLPGHLVRPAVTIGLLGLAGVLLASGYRRLGRRFSDDYLPFSQYYTHAWMRGGAEQLRQLKVPSQARILVLGDEAPNLSLVYFDRRGLAWSPDLGSLNKQVLLTRMAADSLNYLVLPPPAYDRLGPARSSLFADFDLLAERPNVVLRRRDLHYPW